MGRGEGSRGRAGRGEREKGAGENDRGHSLIKSAVLSDSLPFMDAILVCADFVVSPVFSKKQQQN